MVVKMIEISKAEIAPQFSRVDSSGHLITLSDYRDKLNLVLVFNRGFSWPYARKHMASLRHDYQKFVDLKTEVIAVGPENEHVFKDYWEKHSMPFPGIPDPLHITANQASKTGSYASPIHHW
jgi:peroxiredoxin